MKIKILDPNGVHFGGKIVPAGTELELQKGPHTAAWLRFGQAEEVKEKPAKKVAEEDNGAAESSSKDGKKDSVKK